MSGLTTRKLRFSDAVRGLGCTPKTLRNWAQRDQIKIFTPMVNDGWQTYCLADLAVLALTLAMVNFGLTVEAASGIAFEIVRPEVDDRSDDDAFTNRGLALKFVERAVAIFRTEDGWGWQEILHNSASKGFEHVGPAYLVLDLFQIIHSAFERAGESEA